MMLMLMLLACTSCTSHTLQGAAHERGQRSRSTLPLPLNHQLPADEAIAVALCCSNAHCRGPHAAAAAARQIKQVERFHLKGRGSWVCCQQRFNQAGVAVVKRITSAALQTSRVRRQQTMGKQQQVRRQ